MQHVWKEPPVPGKQSVSFFRVFMALSVFSVTWRIFFYPISLYIQHLLYANYQHSSTSMQCGIATYQNFMRMLFIRHLALTYFNQTTIYNFAFRIQYDQYVLSILPLFLTCWALPTSCVEFYAFQNVFRLMKLLFYSEKKIRLASHVVMYFGNMGISDAQKACIHSNLKNLLVKNYSHFENT